MSYSFRLPEEDQICECKYDAVRDRMDREDCPFHCDVTDDPAADEGRAEPPGCERLEAGMKIQNDREADVLSILLSENPVEESDEDKPGVIPDCDKDGYLVGDGIVDGIPC